MRPRLQFYGPEKKPGGFPEPANFPELLQYIVMFWPFFASPEHRIVRCEKEKKVKQAHTTSILKKGGREVRRVSAEGRGRSRKIRDGAF